MTTTRRTILNATVSISTFFGPKQPDPFDIDDMIDDGPDLVLDDDKKQDDKKDDKKQDDKKQDDDDKRKQQQQRKDDRKKDDKKQDDKKDDDKSDFDLKLEESDNDDDQDDDDQDDDKKDDDKKDDDKKDDKKNDKDESNKVLRKQRDELKKQVEEFGNLTPALAKEFSTFLETRFKGQIPTEEELRGEFALVTEKDAEIERLKAEVDDKDKKLSDIDIRMSPDFKKAYADPYNAAAEGLFLEIANLDGNGKALAEGPTNDFFNGLLKLEKLDGVAVKQALTRFQMDFEKTTGEKYVAPSVAAVLTALRGVHEKRASMNDAYNEWGNKKAQTITQRQKEEEENNKATAARNERMRKAQALEALRGFDRAEIEGFMDDNEYTKTFNEEFQYVEGMMKDPTKIPPFKEMLMRGWKARNFDKLLKDWKELKKFKDDHDKKGKSGSRGGGGNNNNDNDDDDWSEGKLD